MLHVMNEITGSTPIAVSELLFASSGVPVKHQHPLWLAHV